MQSFAVAVFFAVVAAASANVGFYGLGHGIGISNYAIAKPAVFAAVHKPAVYAESAQLITPGNSVVSGSVSGPSHFYSGLINKPLIGTYGLGYLGGVAHKL